MNNLKESFVQLFENKLSERDARDLLIALYEKGETAEDIAIAMQVMKNYMLPVTLDPEFQDLAMDNCGTGGDKSGSFNISTTVAFVLAGAGSYVAKHGNRSITSKSGSADVLEKLGFNLNLSPMQHAMLLQQSGFTFMFAQNHHPAMKHIVPIRKSISHRTIFNILGPLTNPAKVKKQLMGVFDKKFISPVINALKISGTKSAIVVSSNDGLDEVSISGLSFYSHLKNGKVSAHELDIEKFGFKKAPFDAIKGGDVDLNASILRGVLNGEIKDAKRDIVIINTALSLVADEKARDIQDGIEIAKDSIDSQKAFKKLEFITSLSQKI